MRNKVLELGKKAVLKGKNAYYGIASGIAMGSAYAMANPMVSNASGDFDSVTINTTTQSAGQMMGNIIGIILTVMRYVGVAMVVYGVYEIVMSIQNNQPEAKTKGIIMALSGVIMIAIKSVLSGLGLLG